MNILKELGSNYEKNIISKKEYIKMMWEKGHSHLFEFSDCLKNNNFIEDILISKSNVIFKLTNGIKLLAIANDYGLVPYVIFNLGKYEELLWNKTIAFLEKSPRTILDIGANIGYFSLFFNKKFPNTKIHCFEPIPNTYKYLQQDLSLNNSENIYAYNFGFSDIKQKVEMYYNLNGSGCSSLKNLNPDDNIEKVMCDFKTLDEFVIENNIDQIDFIKCDVEGAEKFVYEGGLRTIEKFKPVIYSEMLRKWAAKFNYHPNDIIKLLSNLNYDCYAVSEDSLYKIDTVTDDTVETNYIFKQRD